MEAPTPKVLARESLLESRDLAVARAQLVAAEPGGQRRSDFAGCRAQVLALIDELGPPVLDRTTFPGHLTGSACVIDPQRQAMLLLLHAKIRRWLQPGGHADGDANLAHVAWREATEESGISGLKVVVPAIDVDVHQVSSGDDAHLHLDVRFLVVAPPGATASINHESEDAVWVSRDELENYEPDDSLRRLADAGFDLATRLL